MRPTGTSRIRIATLVLSAAFAGGTGRAVDFYLWAVLWQSAGAVLFLVSMAIGWPAVGLAVGAARGEKFAWRRDRPLRRKYQICTSFFMVKSALAAFVLVPLYITEQATALGIGATVLGGAPATGVCAYLAWRILRNQAEPVDRAASE